MPGEPARAGGSTPPPPRPPGPTPPKNAPPPALWASAGSPTLYGLHPHPPPLTSPPPFPPPTTQTSSPPLPPTALRSDTPPLKRSCTRPQIKNPRPLPPPPPPSHHPPPPPLLPPYKPLDNLIFDAKSEVHPELDAFKTAIGNTTDLTGSRLKQASGTSAILDDLYGSAQLTGRNIQEAQRSLDRIASSPSSSVQDQEYAPKLKAALGNVMDNGLPFAGVPAGNQASGYAGLVQKAGDLIHGRAEDVDNLDTMVRKSQSGNKPDVGAQMGAYMNSNSGMGFIKPGTPQFDAANALSDTAQAPLTSGQGLTMWDLKHHLI